MTTSQSTKVSSLIKDLAALEQQSNGSLCENEDLRANAAHLARKLSVALERPHEVVMMNMSIPAQTAAVRLAIDLQLFQHLGNEPAGKNVSELAQKTGADGELLVRILRLLSAMGWVDQVDSASFAPTAITQTVNGSESLQAGVKHMYNLFAVYDKLPAYFVQHNYRPPTDVHDGPFQFAHGIKETTFDYWAKDPEASRIFNTFMTGVRGSRPHWVHWFPVQEAFINGSSGRDEDVLLVDVGGGKGHDLNKFIETFPQARGRYVLEDLPQVIDDSHSRHLKIEALKHDFFQPQPILGARMYFMHHVLHDWPDDDVVKIFARTAEAMKPGYSRLLLGENVLPDMDCHIYPALLDWGMMVLHSGMTRTVGRWKTLLEKAGLMFVKYWPPPGDGDGIIEAVRVDDGGK